MRSWTAKVSILALTVGLAATGCGGDGGGSGGDGGSDGAPDGTSPDAMADGGIEAGADGAVAMPDCTNLAGYTAPMVTCEPRPTDYIPGADDMWDACISDDGTYHPVQDTISSLARVAAYEEIAALLFDPTRDPSAAEFTQARMIYQRSEGIDSRVARRYDPHFSVPDGTDCTADGVPDTYPDYCVGPAKLQPTILNAFAEGMTAGAGEPTRLAAARIDAALLWFFYVSAYKESLTCTTKAKDCDSSYAYYTGCAPGESCNPGGGIGLARRVREVDAEAHAAAWNGALAVRCWRDLDDADTATMLDLRDRARNQYDQAILDGVAALVRDALTKMCATDGLERAYHFEFFRTLAPVLLRRMQEVDMGAALVLRAAAERGLDGLDVTEAIMAIDQVFQCPAGAPAMD